MAQGETSEYDKRHEYWSEMARNIMWAHGDVHLNSDQKMSLYGNGVSVEIIPSYENIPDFRKRNPLPIAYVTFHDQKANVFINEEDYSRFLREICRPEKIDGHKTASYYIGLGVAYRTMDELLARAVASRNEDQQTDYIRRFLDIITKPLNKDDIDFIISHTADTHPNIKSRANSLFENVMKSDETRLGRINILRYAVAAHSLAIEKSNSDWALWCSDDKDRAAYSLAFVEACVFDLMDQVNSWVDQVKFAEIFFKDADYSKIVDNIDEMVIAGSMPMSSSEVNELLNHTKRKV